MKYYAPVFTALVLLLALPMGISSGTHTFTLSRHGAVSPPVTIAIK